MRHLRHLRITRPFLLGAPVIMIAGLAAFYFSHEGRRDSDPPGSPPPGAVSTARTSVTTNSLHALHAHDPQTDPEKSERDLKLEDHDRLISRLEHASDLKTFREVLQRIEESAPQQRDLQSLTDEQVHSTPLLILDYASLLGAAEEHLNRDPERAEAMRSTLVSCARRESVSWTVRSLCVSQYMQLSRDYSLPMDLGPFDPGLVRLAEKTLVKSESASRPQSPGQPGD